MPHERLGWALAALVFVLLLVQSARVAWLQDAPRRRLQRARTRGRAGERRAAAILRREGYRVEAVQPAAEWTILCDDEPLAVSMRADLLVSRDGQSFIAEIKTGECAQLDVATTRRQLLEYSVAYAVDGVLLVDVEAERVQQIRFPLAPAASRSSALPWLAALVVMAIGVWLALPLVTAAK